MKYRQRDERVRGNWPYAAPTVVKDGAAIDLTIQYSRSHTVKDTRTTTFGLLELGELRPEEVSRMASILVASLREAQQQHYDYMDNQLERVREAL